MPSPRAHAHARMCFAYPIRRAALARALPRPPTSLPGSCAGCWRRQGRRCRRRPRRRPPRRRGPRRRRRRRDGCGTATRGSPQASRCGRPCPHRSRRTRVCGIVRHIWAVLSLVPVSHSRLSHTHVCFSFFSVSHSCLFLHLVSESMPPLSCVTFAISAYPATACADLPDVAPPPRRGSEIGTSSFPLSWKSTARHTLPTPLSHTHTDARARACLRSLLPPTAPAHPPSCFLLPIPSCPALAFAGCLVSCAVADGWTCTRICVPIFIVYFVQAAQKVQHGVCRLRSAFFGCPDLEQPQG